MIRTSLFTQNGGSKGENKKRLQGFLNFRVNMIGTSISVYGGFRSPEGKETSGTETEKNGSKIGGAAIARKVARGAVGGEEVRETSACLRRFRIQQLYLSGCFGSLTWNICHVVPRSVYSPH